MGKSEKYYGIILEFDFLKVFLKGVPSKLLLLFIDIPDKFITID